MIRKCVNTIKYGTAKARAIVLLSLLFGIGTVGAIVCAIVFRQILLIFAMVACVFVMITLAQTLVIQGAVVEDAVIMGGTTIASGAVVRHCIVAENVTIGENAVVGAMPEGDEKGVATIGSGVTIGEGAVIGPKAMVSKNVEGGAEEW